MPWANWVDAAGLERLWKSRHVNLWPDMGFKADAASSAEVFSVLYYDREETVQCVSATAKGKAKNAEIVSR